MIMSRKFFNYTFWDVIKSVICCLRCCPFDKHKKFAKGERRVTHELDISRLTIMLRNLKVLTRVFLKDAEREFIKRQRHLILSSENDESHSDNLDLSLRTEKHKKPDQELLEEYLKGYTDKQLTIQERRLIDGIKSKHLGLQDEKDKNTELEKHGLPRVTSDATDADGHATRDPEGALSINNTGRTYA